MKLYKKIFIYSFYYLGLSCLLKIFNRKKVAIIGFHSIGLNNKFYLNQLSLSENEFIKRIKYLSRYYHFFHFSDILRFINNKQPLPRYSCLLYFDDGYLDNITVALPILEKYKAKATIFITTSVLASGESIWPLKLKYLLQKLNKEALIKLLHECKLTGDRELSKNEMVSLIKGQYKQKTKTEVDKFINQLNHGNKELPDLNIMSTEEIVKQYRNHPLIEFASHGKNHINLTNASHEEINSEIIESKNELERIIGKKVLSFSVPSGRINKKAKEKVFTAGYQFIITTIRGLNNYKDFQEQKLLKKITTKPKENFITWKVRLSGLN